MEHPLHYDYCCSTELCGYSPTCHCHYQGTYDSTQQHLHVYDPPLLSRVHFPTLQHPQHSSQFIRFANLQLQQPGYRSQARPGGGIVHLAKISPSTNSCSSPSLLTNYTGRTAIIVNEMRRALNVPETHSHPEASYNQTIQSITNLVKDQYPFEWRNQRHWTQAGTPMSPGWAKNFHEEQQDTMNSIKQNIPQTDNSTRPASGCPMEMRQREDILCWREEELMRREADYFRRERETKEAKQENNILLTGGAHNFAGGDIHINRSGKSIADKGILKLFLNIAPGAFHDSWERLCAPKYYPNTRVTVIQEILGWLDDSQSPELVMWLHGAARAGKSAIVQTIAQVLCEHGRLSGGFFFARESTNGRGDEKRLVPTLGYQLAKYLPETRAHIAAVVLSDPAIFDLTLLSQVQSLLINPLQIISNGMSSSGNSPRLFIIDGLDECLYADAQCRILHVFTAAVKSMQHHLPHRLLIASRPETHLLAGFNEHNTASVCRQLQLSLDNSHYP